MHRTAPHDTATNRGERLTYSVPEAAAQAGISERRMWDRVRNGEIQSYRDGHRRLISRRALEDYIAAREKAAA